MTFDPKAVRDFEHAGWQRAAAHYTTTFAPATRGFINELLDATRVEAGMRVLDLACGPGLVASGAAERGALPVGLDFSSSMIALARADYPGIRFVEGDAEVVSFADEVFDAVVANFGIHHVAEPKRALAEARRVLRPNGRVAFTSWAAPAENIAWRLLFEAISAYDDLKAADTPPPAGSLRSPEDLLSVLHAAGFTDTEARRVRDNWRVAAPRNLVEGFRWGTVRTAALTPSPRRRGRRLKPRLRASPPPIAMRIASLFRSSRSSRRASAVEISGQKAQQRGHAAEDGERL